MKIAEAKETLTRHIDEDTSWVKENNIDILELKKFRSELDNSDSNSTDLSLEQTSRFLEVLSDKEFFKNFLPVKDYLKTKNILTPDNFIQTFEFIERESRNNKETAIEIFMYKIAQLRANLHDHGIFSEENETAVLQNFKYSNSILTALIGLNTARILNSKNVTTVVTLSQSINHAAIAISEILEQLNAADFFKNNQENNQANFDTICQMIAQHTSSYYIADVFSGLNKARILNQASFNMICQNVQHAENIYRAFRTDINEMTESILDLEILTAMYQNPKEADNIVKALKILKNKNILNQEIRTAICQNPQYAAIFVKYANKISRIFEQLNIAKMFNETSFIIVCQTTENAQSALYAKKIIEALKILETEKILNLETLAIVLQNPQIVAQLFEYNKNNAITILKDLDTAKILNKENFETIKNIIHYNSTSVKSIFSDLNIAGIFDQTKLNLVCRNSQFIENIARAFAILKTENIHNPETLTVICQSPQYAENIVKALKDLKAADILNSEIQTGICQNPEMIFNIRHNFFNFINTIKVLKNANILNKANFITNCQIMIQSKESFYTESLYSMLDNAKLFDQTSFNMISLNAQHINDIYRILSFLNTINILNSETLTAVCQNPKYAEIIKDALHDLNHRNILNSETQTVICQNPQYIATIVEALKTLDAEYILTPVNQTTICKNPKYARNIADSIKSLKTEKMLDLKNESAVCKNPQYAMNIVDTLKTLKIAKMLNFKNRTAIYQNAQHLQVINIAFKALNKAQKLTQPLIDDIFAHPKDALFIAEKNGGKPAGNQIAKDFSQVRSASQLLVQAWRQNSPFTSTSETRKTEIGDLPVELLEKIAAESVIELDENVSEHVTRQIFSKS